jgi:uncharacterized membrane protein HdeD (DUF308 family)
MDLVPTLNLLAFAALFTVGIVPFYMSFKVKVKSLRILSLLLGLFASIHGLYHLAFDFNQPFLATVVLDPVSAIFLLAFGLYYSKRGIP